MSGKGEKKEVDIHVGPSHTRTKRVMCPGVRKVDHNPVNAQLAEWKDRFTVRVHKEEGWFEVTRHDADAGWGQPLVLRAKVRHHGGYEQQAEQKAPQWTKLEGSACCIGTDRQGHTICCDAAHATFEKKLEDPKWTKAEGICRHVARGADGATWTTTPDEKICRKEKDKWVQRPGAAVQVYVGSEQEVVCISHSGNIFKWDGNNFKALPGTFKNASIAHDGTFYAIDNAGAIHKWQGGAWAKVPGTATFVAVADKDHVFIIDPSGQVQQSNDGGASWKPLPPGPQKFLAAAPGHLYAINASNQISYIKI